MEIRFVIVTKRGRNRKSGGDIYWITGGGERGAESPTSDFLSHFFGICQILPPHSILWGTWERILNFRGFGGSNSIFIFVFGNLPNARKSLRLTLRGEWGKCQRMSLRTDLGRNNSCSRMLSHQVTADSPFSLQLIRVFFWRTAIPMREVGYCVISPRREKYPPPQCCKIIPSYCFFVF